jgi:lantibiotic modifying enzyme
MAFALHRVHLVTGDPRYRDGALAVVRWLHEQAAAGGDSGWTPFNDVLFGDAGTALYLVHAARELGDRPSLELSARVGRRLIGRARRDRGGLTWVLREGGETILPNFSHGGAGVGYLLATLYEETRSAEFDRAARDAATYLLAIARHDSGALRVPYGFDRPEWTTRYDIGWAHGAAGTSRLFERLARATGDTTWRRHVRAAEVAIRLGGIPGEPTWRGDSGDSGNSAAVELDRRFGLAGVADFYLDLYGRTGDRGALQAASRIVDHLLARATDDDGRLHWLAPRQAFMSDPGAPGALTGYLHGAVGYGLLLLRLDAAMRGRPWTLRFPDSPY